MAICANALGGPTAIPAEMRAAALQRFEAFAAQGAGRSGRSQEKGVAPPSAAPYPPSRDRVASCDRLLPGEEVEEMVGGLRTRPVCSFRHTRLCDATPRWN